MGDRGKCNDIFFSKLFDPLLKIENKHHFKTNYIILKQIKL